MKVKSFLEKLQLIPTDDLRKKVIGAQAADPGEYPWQVLFKNWIKQH